LLYEISLQYFAKTMEVSELAATVTGRSNSKCRVCKLNAPKLQCKHGLEWVHLSLQFAYIIIGWISH